MTVRILDGDCLAVLPSLEAQSVDAIVTDPPYGLGFMGKAWDHGVPGVPFWQEALRVAKPGAHLVAFGGTRTHHRLTCAIEDAGWEVRDCLMWLYGSGFPKSHNGSWGGTALKPAWEPIILARKPLAGTVAANVTAHGTGALNIAATRIGHASADGLAASLAKNPGRTDTVTSGTYGANRPQQSVNTAGRWPANVVLDEEAAALLDAQSGERGAVAPVRGSEPSAASTGRVTGERARVPGAFHGDTGGASRFFYCAKASRAERNAGVEHMPARPLNWSSGEQSPGTFQSPGTERAAANHHPTVKPVALMRWLCRLVTPPHGVVLDPFMGSGSTGVAAVPEGFGFIGIEERADYAAIARARIHAAAPLLAGELG